MHTKSNTLRVRATLGLAAGLLLQATIERCPAQSFSWPVDTHPIGQYYAAYDNGAPNKYHTGMDIGDGNTNYATTVKAVRAGTVHKIFGLYSLPSSSNLRRWNSATGAYSWDGQPTSDRLGQSYGTDNHGLGICVIIYHADLQLYTVYGHLDAVVSGLATGQNVLAGSPIGRMGNSYKQYLRRSPTAAGTPPTPQGNPPTGYAWSNLIIADSSGFRSHVHLEVKDRGVLSAGRSDSPTSAAEQHWGYTPGPSPSSSDKPGHPNFWGYHDPNIFLNETVTKLAQQLPIEILGALDVWDYPSTAASLSLIITRIAARGDGRFPAFVAARSVGNQWYQIFLPNSETEGWSASGWIAGNVGGTTFSRANEALPQVKVTAESAGVFASASTSSSALAYAYGQGLIDEQRFVPFESPSGWYRIFTPQKTAQSDGWLLSSAVTFVPGSTTVNSTTSFRLLAGTGSGGTNPFSLVELQTNPAREVPVIPNTVYFPALDMAPDGRLYGASSSLYLINATNGTVTRIGDIHSTINPSISVRGIAFSPEGILYANSVADAGGESILYTINTTTAQAREVGPISGGVVWGIDFAPDGGLYGALSSLYLLNRNTGRVITEIGTLSAGRVLDIDFAADGFIYGVHYSSQTLYRVNPNSAASTIVSVYQSELWGIASQPRSGPTGVPPSILTQPASQSVSPGASVTLSVVANGTAPLSYQWRFNGSALAGATSPTLTLNNVTASHAGTYSVVVANAYSSVTSASATLAIGVALPFRLLAGTGSEGSNPFSLLELQTSPIREVPVISNTRYFTALDMAPDGRLYGASDDLYLINSVSGTVTTIVTIYTSGNSSISINCIAFSPEGTLYATGLDFDTFTTFLYTVDTITALARPVGPITGGTVWGIDFAPDGRLYGAFSSLYLLDRSTGRVISEVGTLSSGKVVDIDFASDGYIYGVDYSSQTLYRINPNTADSTPIGIYQTELWGVASQPLPNVNPTKAALTDPTPASTLSSATATFSWSGGNGVSDYVLNVGRSAGSKEYYSQDRGLNRTATVSGLPTDGSIIYVTLWSLIAGKWQSSEATYTAFKAAATKAALTEPTPGSALVSATAIFSWSSGTGVSDYVLYVGRSAGGKEHYSQDRGLNRTATVQNLP